jgi:hypothetical protein
MSPRASRTGLVAALPFRSSDAEPKEIRASVMDHCVVDERGQAVLRLPGL